MEGREESQGRAALADSLSTVRREADELRMQLEQVRLHWHDRKHGGRGSRAGLGERNWPSAAVGSSCTRQGRVVISV